MNDFRSRMCVLPPFFFLSLPFPFFLSPLRISVNTASYLPFESFIVRDVILNYLFHHSSHARGHYEEDTPSHATTAYGTLWTFFPWKGAYVDAMLDASLPLPAPRKVLTCPIQNRYSGSNRARVHACSWEFLPHRTIQYLPPWLPRPCYCRPLRSQPYHRHDPPWYYDIQNHARKSIDRRRRSLLWVPLPFASPAAGSVNPPPEAASSASRSASLLSQAGQGQPYRPPLPAGALRQPQNGDLYPPPIHPRPMPNGQVNIVGVSGRPQAGSSASGASPVPTTLPSPAPHPAPSVTSPPPTPLTTNRSTSLSTIGPERHIPANLPANLAAEICGVRQEHIPTPPLKILPDKINCTQHCLPGSKHETFPPN